VKVLKISRKKSLNSLQETPTPSEGNQESDTHLSRPSQSQTNTNRESVIPTVPKLPPGPKKPKQANPLMTDNENAMRQFLFRKVDELESEKKDVPAQKQQTATKPSQQYIQEVIDKIGLAQQAVEKVYEKHQQMKNKQNMQLHQIVSSESSYS